MRISSGSFNATSVVNGTILIVLLLSSLPRVVHSSLPYNISGLDLAIPVALAGLLLSCFLRQNVVWPRNILQMFILLPVLMGVMALAGYFVTDDRDSLVRAILQASRRLAPAILCLLLCQMHFSMAQSQRWIKIWLLSLVLGAAFFIMIDNYAPFGLKNRTALTGNFLREMGEGDSDDEGVHFMSTTRMAGNAASPTTFGVLCAIGLVVVNHQMLRRQMSFFTGAFFYLSFCGALIASAAKAAIAAAGLTQAIQLGKNLRLALVLLAIGITVVAIYYENITQLAISVATRSSSSMDARWDKYDEAANLISREPIRFFLGTGFRSDEVGWHNEAIEIMMGYGAVVGTIVLFLVYVYLPFTIWRLPSETSDLLPNGLLFMIYGIILLSSVFQDLYHDSYILLTLVLLIGLRYQTLPPEVDDESPDLESHAMEN